MNLKHYEIRKEDLQLFSVRCLDFGSDNERLNHGNGGAVECKRVNKSWIGHRLKVKL